MCKDRYVASKLGLTISISFVSFKFFPLTNYCKITFFVPSAVTFIVPNPT